MNKNDDHIGLGMAFLKFSDKYYTSVCLQACWPVFSWEIRVCCLLMKMVVMVPVQPLFRTDMWPGFLLWIRENDWGFIHSFYLGTARQKQYTCQEKKPKAACVYFFQERSVLWVLTKMYVMFIKKFKWSYYIIYISVKYTRVPVFIIF